MDHLIYVGVVDSVEKVPENALFRNAKGELEPINIVKKVIDLKGKDSIGPYYTSAALDTALVTQEAFDSLYEIGIPNSVGLAEDLYNESAIDNSYTVLIEGNDDDEDGDEDAEDNNVTVENEDETLHDELGFYPVDSEESSESISVLSLFMLEKHVNSILSHLQTHMGFGWDHKIHLYSWKFELDETSTDVEGVIYAMAFNGRKFALITNALFIKPFTLVSAMNEISLKKHIIEYSNNEMLTTDVPSYTFSIVEALIKLTRTFRNYEIHNTYVVGTTWSDMGEIDNLDTNCPTTRQSAMCLLYATDQDSLDRLDNGRDYRYSTNLLTELIENAYTRVNESIALFLITSFVAPAREKYFSSVDNESVDFVLRDIAQLSSLNMIKLAAAMRTVRENPAWAEQIPDSSPVIVSLDDLYT